MALPLRSLATYLGRKCTVYISHMTGNASVQGKKLLLKGETDAEQQTIDLDSIRRIVLIGRPRADADALYAFMQAGIPVDWLDIFGKPKGQLLSLAKDSFRYPIQQQDFAATPLALELARSILWAKAENSAYILKKRAVLPEGWPQALALFQTATTADTLRGAEGYVANLYFSQWDKLVGQFEWLGRHYYPATDPINAMLSLGYSLLYNRLASALHHVGLDARIGFFHLTRGTHFALASDLMEPFRPIVDNTVLTIVRKRIASPEQFSMKDDACYISDRELFSTILKKFEEMFSRSYTVYADDNGSWVERKCSLNDHIDDLAEYYYDIIKTKTFHHDWRLSV